MAFLRDNLPASDLDTYPYSYFLACADHALMVRERFPWCAGLEEEIFFHYVLCPRVNDEDLSEHRPLFFAQLCPRVEGLSLEEAVLAVNRWCQEQASYQLQDDRTASPLTVYRCGSGRCGEESAFLTAALRSVGIAARQVYAPRWSHCDDNHAWVEALCGEEWRFLGACEPEPVLDRGWFNSAAARAMLVHSRTFGRGESPLHGEPLECRGAVCWYNQTGRYAETRPYRLRALRGGAPVPGARFYLQVLNEAGYQTISVLTAGADGRAQAALGVGDLHVRAVSGDLEAEGDCADGALVLELAPPEPPDGRWHDFDAHAPQGGPPPAPLTAEQKARRAADLAEGDRLRQARMAGWYDAGRAALLPGREDLLREARGNFDTVFAFLNGADGGGREKLLRTLARKDLRDLTGDTAEDHWLHRPPRPEELPEEVYWSALCAPRVALEPLTPWRGPLSARWTAEERDRLRANPETLPSFLLERVRLEGARTYENLYWPPLAALEAGRCDEKSFRVLCVAQLRALGVPARLRPLDGVPEYWREGAFHPLKPEASAGLTLTRTAEQAPLYGQNWTLSRHTTGGWRRLSLTGRGWEGLECPLCLPAGRYRVTTAVRLPSGDQLAARQDLDLEPGASRTLALRLRTFGLEDLLTCRQLPSLPAVTLDGAQIPDAARWGTRPALLLWLEEGGEPTEHVLNELAAGQAALEALPVEVRLLLRGRESLEHPALAALLRRWPGIRVLLDDWAFDLEAAARCLTLDPERAPLCVACNAAGQAVYGVSGYRVGCVELLTRVLDRLCAG